MICSAIFNPCQSDDDGLFHIKALKSKVLLTPWGREEKLWVESREGRAVETYLHQEEEGTGQLTYSIPNADIHLETGSKQQLNKIDGLLLFGEKKNFLEKWLHLN